MTKSVYLAGPIAGLTYDEATDWRTDAIKQLNIYGVKGLSPLRWKEYLKRLGVLDSNHNAYGHLSPLSTSRGIMVRDFFDATRCDALLVNFLGAKKVSIGTCMEIAWAYQNHTPVVCVMEKEGNPHEHAMISEAIGFRAESLAEGLDIVLAVLG